MVVRDAGKWLSDLGFALLSCNSALEIYRSKGDTWSVAFVASAYFSLLLLFWFQQLCECAGTNAAQRGKLKGVIWSLLTFLTGMFLYKVAAFMPWPVALLVYGMAAATVSGGFYAFFIYRNS